MMKERPIIFSGPMVLAILDGRKTQTRRVLKTERLPNSLANPLRSCWAVSTHEERREFAHLLLGVCPYGVPGDRLWVREAWRVPITWNNDPPRNLCPTLQVWYGRDAVTVGHPNTAIEPGRLRSPRHMMRWASRITLEVTDVRVQRVQDIRRHEALSEGVRPPRSAGMGFGAAGWDPKDAFAELWNGINAKRGFGWDTNPWVWAITFKRILQTETT